MSEVEGGGGGLGDGEGIVDVGRLESSRLVLLRTQTQRRTPLPHPTARLHRASHLRYERASLEIEGVIRGGAGAMAPQWGEFLDRKS